MNIRTAAFFVFFFLLVSCVPAVAQPTQDVGKLCEKYGADFDHVSGWLTTNPPLKPGDTEREYVLKKIDAPLLEPDAKYMPCVGKFFQDRMAVFMSDFTRHRPESGVYVWKLYNHTEIIRTKGVTIAIDLFPGFDQVEFQPDMLAEIVKNVDVLLVTHIHGDHTSPRIVKMFVDAGKKVLMPDGIWMPGGDQPEALAGFPDADAIRKGITYIREGEVKLPGATVRVFPAWQKGTADNVYLITTAEGRTIMHIGDLNALLYHPADVWFKKLHGGGLKIDLLIVNCWSPDLKVMFGYVHPKLIMSSHEHELGHDVPGRRPYSYVYTTLGGYGMPFIVPAWGERYDIGVPQK